MKRGQKNSDKVPRWALWFVDYGLAALMTIGLSGIILAAVAAYWIDSRINRLEDRLGQKPPQSYSPPDLDKYQATEFADDESVTEQLIYVPAYSHVYLGGGRPYLMETTLSVRNPSPNSSVYVRTVRYFDTEGKLLKKLVDRLIELKPLQSIEFVIPQKDSSGGSGANFLVEWLEADDSVSPLVEAIMVGNAGAQGISFRTEGFQVSHAEATDFDE